MRGIAAHRTVMSPANATARCRDKMRRAPHTSRLARRRRLRDTVQRSVEPPLPLPRLRLAPQPISRPDPNRRAMRERHGHAEIGRPAATRRGGRGAMTRTDDCRLTIALRNGD
jgi:hypothetical protein